MLEDESTGNGVVLEDQGQRSVWAGVSVSVHHKGDAVWPVPGTVDTPQTAAGHSV